jgi:hypothetical protein
MTQPNAIGKLQGERRRGSVAIDGHGAGDTRQLRLIEVRRLFEADGCRGPLLIDLVVNHAREIEHQAVVSRMGAIAHGHGGCVLRPNRA